MDSLAVLATQLKWLANVTQADGFLTTVTDICPINYEAVFYWLLIFTLIPFAFPASFLLLLFLASFIANVYFKLHRLINRSSDDKALDNLTYITTRFWYYYGRLWHGYEIEGLENIPTKGSAVIAYYHGPIPVDIWLMMSHIYVYRKKLMRLVVDRFFYHIPGFQLGLRILKALPGSIETCSKLLDDGHLIAIAPGGTYECVFGDNNYRLLWRNRLGYAKVAIKSKSPVIPVFTVNIGDAFRVTGMCRGWSEKSYLRRRLPFILTYGGGPVKLKTIVGQPIPFDPSLTAEELNRKVMLSIEQMINHHQRIPGSIPMALLDRFYCGKKRS